MWPSSLFTRRRWRPAPARRKASSCRLALEALEDRCLLSANIDVSNSMGRQEEPAIDINPLNPLHLVAAANSGTDSPTKYNVEAYFSRDGGLTWRSSTVPLTIDGVVYTSSADPSVAFDSRGNVYVSYVLARQYYQSQALAVAKSSDGGETFSQVRLVQPPNALNDHPFLAIDTNPTSPFRDTLYVSWTNRAFGPPPFSVNLELSRSTDGGQTWSDAVKVDDTPAGLSVAFSDQAISPDGTLYITWTGDINTSNGGAKQFVDISTDGGRTFGRDLAVTPLNTNDATFGFGFSSPAQPSRVFKGLSFIAAQPALDTDRSSGQFHGRLYLVYADRPDPVAQPFSTDIYLQFSDDGGRRWSPRLLINDDGPGNSHFFPSLSVDPADGTVVISWYDTRRDAANDQKSDLFLAIGTPTRRGVAFGPNQRVTEEQSDESVNNQHAQGSYGDYAGLVAFGGVAHPVWCDARLSNFPPGSTLREEIYTASVRYSSSLLANAIGSASATGAMLSPRKHGTREALARGQAAGVDTSRLGDIDVRIADLGGTTLGLVSGSTLWLDANAAGWGWFYPTPGDDSAFTTPGDQGDAGRRDLLSVLAHAIGPLLGYGQDDGAMAAALAAGTRPATSRSLDADTTWLGIDALFAQLTAAEETPWLRSSIFGRYRKMK